MNINLIIALTIAAYIAYHIFVAFMVYKAKLNMIHLVLKILFSVMIWSLYYTAISEIGEQTYNVVEASTPIILTYLFFILPLFIADTIFSINSTKDK